MARLSYSTIGSLDGYVVDADGRFDWAAPDEELHALVNDLERPIGTYLYGRRMYEVMRAWETMHHVATQSSAVADYTQIWQAADKIVYSTTLDDVSTARTSLAPEFDPDAVRELLAGADQDMSIGGPTLAARAIAAGLVDEYHLFKTPILVGGGIPVFPAGVRLELDLVDESRFASGVVHLHYRTRRPSGTSTDG